MRDVRRAGYCSRGARGVFKDNGLDWQHFLDHGIELDELRLKIDKHFCDKLEETHGQR
jgi:hypothetical protein